MGAVVANEGREGEDREERDVRAIVMKNVVSSKEEDEGSLPCC